MTADPRVTHSRRRQIVERTLAAIADSPHRNRFALRGAWAFMAWQGDLHRSTDGIDLADLEAQDDPAPAIQAALSTGNWAIEVNWRSATATRRDQGWTTYTRILVDARALGQSVPLRLTVAALRRARDHTERLRPLSVRRGCVLPTMVCLSREWMVAEKLSLLVTYGAGHTRVQDIADLWELQRRFIFDGCALTKAWCASVEGRDADLLLRAGGDGWKAGLSPARLGRPHRLAWERAAGGRVGAPDLAVALRAVARFAVPLLESVRDATTAPHRWRPGAGWSRGPFASPQAITQAVLPLWAKEGSKGSLELAP